MRQLHGIMGDVAVHTTSRTLVGRDAELAELASLLGVRRPSPGPSPPTPRAVLLAGDAGVGKTRLLTELRDLAVTEGWQVVAGHCLDFGDSALPYLPFSEVLGRLASRPARRRRAASPTPHPALARLQPGRRMLSRGRRRRPTGRARDARPRRPVRGDARAARGGRREGPAAAGHRGRPLGRPVDPRHAQLPVLPAVRGPGRDRGVATAPTTCTAATRCAARSPSGRGCAASTGSSSSRSPTTEVRALVASCTPSADRRGRARRHRRTAPRATRSSSRSSSAPPREPGGGCPTTSPTCCWSASTGSTTPPARWSGRPASPAARSPTTCSPRPPGWPPPSSTRRSAQAVESNVLVAGDDRYAFRHALLAEAVYDDLLPGERVRLHAAYAEALREGRGRGTAAELARHARLAHDLADRARGQHPGRRRGDGGRRPRRGRAPLPAGARAARRPAPLRDAPSTSPRWWSRPPRRWSPPACRTAPPRWSRSSSSAADGRPDAMRARLLAARAHTLLLSDNAD